MWPPWARSQHLEQGARPEPPLQVEHSSGSLSRPHPPGAFLLHWTRIRIVVLLLVCALLDYSTKPCPSRVYITVPMEATSASAYGTCPCGWANASLPSPRSAPSLLGHPSSDSKWQSRTEQLEHTGESSSLASKGPDLQAPRPPLHGTPLRVPGAEGLWDKNTATCLFDCYHHMGSQRKAKKGVKNNNI